MKDFFISKTPQSAFLKKHIAYYYFHQVGEDNTPSSYIYYPHYKNALSIYRDSELTLKSDYHSITKPKPCGDTFAFTKLTNSAARAEIHPPFNKIGVVFQPLGLNNFIKGNISDHLEKPINLKFNYFKESMQPILDQVYNTTDADKKVELLDAYFLEIYTGFKATKIEEAIELLLNSNEKYNVEALAKELEISRKTLYRLFQKHQNCSAIDYIKLIQFRKSIDIFQKALDKTTLTELAYNTEYYDQADFIHHFKKLTGFNPKPFFKDISDLGKEGTYWTFR